MLDHFRFALIIASSFVLGTSAAFADHMTLTKAENPTEARYPGVSLDILGVKPGMSIDAVKKVLIANYHSAPGAFSEQMSATYKSISMSSQSYISQLSSTSKNGDDYIVVYFGTPATGNTVVGIHRELNFPDAKNAPTMDALHTALDKKYGPESSKSSTFYDYTYRNWLFGKLHHLPSCPDEPVYTAGDTSCDCTSSLPKQDLKYGKYVCVNARIEKSSQDPSRVQKLFVNLNNQADKVLSSDEALKQIQAAAVAAYKKEANPEVVPKL